MAPPIKRGETSPWRRDGRAIFGRDTPVTPWQMRDVGINDLDGDERCHDEDQNEAIGALRELRRGGKSSKFTVGARSAERANAAWMESRALHQATLAESRGEKVDLPVGSLSFSSRRDRFVEDLPPVNQMPQVNVLEPAIPLQPKKVRFGKPPKNADPITKWVMTPGTQRPWETLKQIVSDPVALGKMIKIVWELRYGTSTPVPDDVVFVTRKKGKGIEAHAHELHVFPATPEMQEYVDGHYEVYARLTIRRRSEDESIPIRPSRGRSSQELMQQVVQAQTDLDVGNAVARNAIAQISGGKDNATSVEEKLIWSGVLAFVREHARNLVPKIEEISVEVNPDADFLLPECALTVLKTMPGEGATAFKIMSVADALKLGAQYSVALLKQHSLMRYYISGLKGGNALDVGFAWLAGMELPITETIERYWVSTGWRSGNVHNLPSVEWQDYLMWIEQNALELPIRQLTIARYLNNPFIEEDASVAENDDDAFLESPSIRNLGQLTWSMRRESRSGTHWMNSTQLDFSPQAAEERGRDVGIIKWGEFGDIPFMKTIEGTGALDVALAWLRGRGVIQRNPIEAGFVAGTWKYPITWADHHLGIDGTHRAPKWKTEFLPYIQEMGPRFLPRMRELFEAVRGHSPNELVVVAQRIKRPDGYDVGNMQVITPDELDEFNNESRLLRIRFAKSADGHEEVIQIKGVGKDEVAPLILGGVEGGIVFAPDAGQMEEAARQVATYGSEKFGNLEDQICKPEPLITPADVMPVPQLTRPSDAVDLPKLGGYVTLDPDDLKNIQTPPSDRIPVITGSREESVEDMGAAATVAAMVMGVVALLYGGATLLRAPMGNPAFGSGGGFLSPRDRWEAEGT